MTLAWALLAASCAGVKQQPIGGTGGGGATTGTGGQGTGGSPTVSTGGTGGGHVQTGVCQNLQCQQTSCRMGPCTQTACPGGGTTSVSGTVYDPAGKVPLYNVVVFVPNAPLAPLADGASCQTCSGYFTGKPIAVTLTDTAGKFTLTDVPVGANIPLVIQVGKWRRQIAVSTTSCTDTPLNDPTLTRLPRNKSEGDIPKIAVATGHSDALECLLRKVGLDDAEFTNDSGSGRVQLFQGYQASPTVAVGASQPLSPVDSLWSSVTSLARYDVVLMACEGDSGQSEGRTAPQYQAVRGYADVGGRIFGSHYHTNWIRSEDGQPNAGYPQVVKFASGEGPLPDGFVTTVNTTFPKGMAFGEWLVNVGASTTPGQLAVNGSKHLVDSVIGTMATPWLTGYDTSKKTPTVQYFSFTTPIGAPECGRMVFSDVHVSAGGGDIGTVPFPSRCDMISAVLSPQEKALEFMLFDISSCVQPEGQMPVPPISVD